MGKAAKLKKLKREMRTYTEAGHTPIQALHASYLYGTTIGYQLDHRTLRRLMPVSTTIRITRVRKNKTGTYTRYGHLVVQRGSLAHEACIAHPEHGFLLVDGAIAALRRNPEPSDGQLDEDLDPDPLTADDIDTETDIDPVLDDNEPCPTCDGRQPSCSTCHPPNLRRRDQIPEGCELCIGCPDCLTDAPMPDGSTVEVPL